MNIGDISKDAEILRGAALEAEARPIRYRKIDILDYSPTVDLDSQLAWPGTIVVYVARKGSKFLSAIRDAVKKKDGREAKLMARIHELSEGRAPLPLAEAVKLLVKEPVFADVRHGSATLASSLCTPKGSEVIAAVLPYNGGALLKEGLTLVEHYRDGSSAELEAVAVRHEPKLTKAEKAALRQVGTDQRELNLGRAAMCWAVTLVAVALVVTLAVICRPPWKDEVEDPIRPIDDDDVRKLGPAATARHLLERRRALLDRRLAR